MADFDFALRDEKPLFDQIDLTKSWDHPVNQPFHKTVIQVYQCPSAELTEPHTTYMAVVGKEAAFDSHEARTFRDIKDGASNTVFVVEALPENAVHWMSPHDVPADDLLGLNEESATAHEGGIQMLWGDGRVTFLSLDAPTEFRRAITTINGGEEVIEPER